MTKKFKQHLDFINQKNIPIQNVGNEQKYQETDIIMLGFIKKL